MRNIMQGDGSQQPVAKTDVRCQRGKVPPGKHTDAADELASI
jgi:hypothetical protein